MIRPDAALTAEIRELGRRQYGVSGMLGSLAEDFRAWDRAQGDSLDPLIKKWGRAAVAVIVAARFVRHAQDYRAEARHWGRAVMEAFGHSHDVEDMTPVRYLWGVYVSPFALATGVEE